MNRDQIRKIFIQTQIADAALRNEQAKVSKQAKKLVRESARAQGVADVMSIAKSVIDRDHAINPLWPGAAPSRGPWAARDITGIGPLAVAATPTMAPPEDPAAVLGALTQQQSTATKLAGLAIGLGVGLMWGRSKGKSQKRSGQRYSFGGLQAASVLLGGPLGLGYQAGRYLSYKG